MGTQTRICLAACCIGLLCGSGCGPRRQTLLEVLPDGAAASPWVLKDSAWTGDVEAAAAGLGDEAALWRKLQPQRVWLANYTHDAHPGRRLTVRAFAFDSTEHTQAAFAQVQPRDPQRFDAGDEGCWTRDGVTFRWGRLIFDVFDAAERNREQAVYLVGVIEKRMPPGLPSEPK